MLGYISSYLCDKKQFCTICTLVIFFTFFLRLNITIFHNYKYLLLAKYNNYKDLSFAGLRKLIAQSAPSICHGNQNPRILILYGDNSVKSLGTRLMSC
jgi:hypothetical protein